MIKFFKEGSDVVLKTVGLTKPIIKEIFADHKLILKSLNIIFITNAEILEINKNHLNHDYYTDIITFDLGNEPKKKEGEIYISWEMAKENSVKYKVDYYDELSRLIIHGCLHLSGHKDKNPEEKKEMTAKENYYLKNLVSRETY
ncbi:MAG: rRNA maturation RNase YbeY [Bacteroidetes bacterium]|nr:rRNA maturation RNase YbeY [Bacteroidota bacterium]